MLDLIIFISVLSVLVIVHEWGHFVTARALGVRVEKFSVGFGKKLFSWKRENTEYMICALPLGGYVKMAGEERSQSTGKPDEFFSLAPGRRALIVFMGPVVNFVFAFVCFYGIFLTGFPTRSPHIGKILEGSPAYAAGLEGGDDILAIDTVPIKSWEDVQGYVANSTAETIHFVVNRKGGKLVLPVTPEQKVRKNIFEQEEKSRMVGIMDSGEVVFLSYGPVESLGKAFGQIKTITSMTLKALYYVATGAMPAKDAFAGPIGIYGVVKYAAAQGLTTLLLIMASISTSLAIFNLFPVPVLDGGHLFFLGIERLRGKPLPLKVEENLTKTGLSLLVCLMLFIFYNDIVRAGWVEKIYGFFQHLCPAKN